jgi:glutamine synthetase
MHQQYGVQYTPSNVSTTTALTLEHLQYQGVQCIRIQWVDLINHVRYRILPIAYFIKLLSSNRPGVCIAKATFGLAFITLAQGFDAAGEYLYVPDLSSLTLCPYAPAHATVTGWFQEKVPIQGPLGPTFDVDACPRTALRRVIE